MDLDETAESSPDKLTYELAVDSSLVATYGYRYEH